MVLDVEYVRHLATVAKAEVEANASPSEASAILGTFWAEHVLESPLNADEAGWLERNVTESASEEPLPSPRWYWRRLKPRRRTLKLRPRSPARLVNVAK
ncbi:MAG: hypothetical protein DLM55_05550 [Acidimicrobiales bacterium]|nr:MAG: hypothetical protein DLM55_05550 [Acidimicrobiales bacterium]